MSVYSRSLEVLYDLPLGPTSVHTGARELRARVCRALAADALRHWLSTAKAIAGELSSVTEAPVELSLPYRTEEDVAAALDGPLRAVYAVKANGISPVLGPALDLVRERVVGVLARALSRSESGHQLAASYLLAHGPARVALGRTMTGSDPVAGDLRLLSKKHGYELAGPGDAMTDRDWQAVMDEFVPRLTVSTAGIDGALRAPDANQRALSPARSEALLNALCGQWAEVVIRG